MISSNELRIGNKVLHPKDDSIIFTIDREDFAVTNGLANLEDFRPIPITEEWLLDFGFVVGESLCDREAKIYSFQVSNADSLYFDDNDWYISHEWDNNHFKNTFWNQPKYVHQLQNLVHSLTGEELCLKN